MKAYKRTIYIISALIILLVGIYFDLKEDGMTTVEAAETTTLNASTDTDISRLMASLNIQQLAETVQAPDFELMSINSKKLRLSNYRGKVVLLSFWATW